MNRKAFAIRKTKKNRLAGRVKSLSTSLAVALLLACGETTDQRTDDRLTAAHGEERWLSFKEKISSGTAEYIEKNLHLADELTEELIWCDYIVAESPKEIEALIRLTQDSITETRKSGAEDEAVKLETLLRRLHNPTEDMVRAREAKTECLEALERTAIAE